MDQFVLNQRRTRERADAATYDAGESIVAYYGMGTFHRKYLTFLAGLRVERTETNFTGNEVLISDSGEYLQTNPVSGSSGYTNTFPSFHLKMDRGKRLTFIGSWTKAIERPSFSSLTPYRRVDLEDRELSEGNPDLKPTLYSNLDLSLDYNLHDDDLISLEFFYKTVDDVIFSRTSTLLSGTYAGFERNRDENSASGSLWGIELTWYQSLDILPILPKGLKLNTNYIYSNSQFEYPNRPEQPLAIANHPNQKLQLAITYDLGKFYAQLKIEHQSNTVSRVADVPEEDWFKEGITEVALTASCRLSEHLRIVGGVRRLTDTPSEVVYEGNRDQLVRYRYRGRSANLGLKYEW
jgi:TonB-dependent receptor